MRIHRWLLPLMACTALLSACSSKVNDSEELDPQLAESTCKGAACATCELPWGGTLAAGESMDSAFSKELVECDQSCSTFGVKLTCKEGVLIGEKQDGTTFTSMLGIAKSCYRKRCDCLHAGVTVEDGASRGFFRSATASCGARCEQRSFDCKSGKLIDTDLPKGPSTTASFAASACTEIPCQACNTPWGSSVAHGGTTTAYSAAVAPCNQACSSVQTTLTCNNGVLSGGSLATYKYGACTTRTCQTCTLGSGDLIAHGATVKAYKANTSTCEVSCSALGKDLKCTDGTVEGGSPAEYKFNSCTAATCQTCTLPCGTVVGSGGFGYCFKSNKPAACGQTCLGQRKQFNCMNGTVSAADETPMASNSAYTLTSCTEQSACNPCTLPDGRQIVDGAKATLFKADNLACGQSCFAPTNAVTLTCANGTFANQALYQDFKKTKCDSSCTVSTGNEGIGRVGGDGGGAPVNWCQLPWGGGLVGHDTQVVAYSVMKAPPGTKCSQFKTIITCNAYRGLLTGGATYIYPICKE